MSELVGRSSEDLLKKLRKSYPVITVTGPRQSGKTTLCRMAFPDLPYVNLEAPDRREFATSDPRSFLKPLSGGAILDEFQHVPELPSYIQEMVDEPNFNGLFVLTGSRNLSVRTAVNQSLAGRTAMVCLLPFSYPEICAGWGDQSINEMLFRGSFPRIYDRHLDPPQALSAYVGTYIERDLRQMALIRDLPLFQKFLGLCAGRIGQLLNLESLGNDTGISQTTAREWLSLLEAGYIAFRLPPYFTNISKRLIKTPKLYFYDVGLAAHLMGITNLDQITTHPLKGMLFENLIILECMKFFMNRGLSPLFHFYRDSNGNEVDLIIPRGRDQMPIEIKAAETVQSAFFKGLNRFMDAVPDAGPSALIYGGEETGERSGIQIVNLPVVASFLKDKLNS